MRCARNWRHSLRLIAISPLLMLSIACTPASSVRVLPRALPAAPAFAAPVKVLKPPAGTDWEVVARREQNGRLEANARIVKFRAWYEERRAELGEGGK